MTRKTRGGPSGPSGATPSEADRRARGMARLNVRVDAHVCAVIEVCAKKRGLSLGKLIEQLARRDKEMRGMLEAK